MWPIASSSSPSLWQIVAALFRRAASSMASAPDARMRRAIASSATLFASLSAFSSPIDSRIAAKLHDTAETLSSSPSP